MVATRPITIQEFERITLDGRWELIDGEPVEMTPSADESSSIGATILGFLAPYVRESRLGRLYGADGDFVLFPDRPTVRVPDVAFVRADRAPQGEARKSFPRLAPDLVVEVLSPSDRASEVVAKLEMYQATHLADRPGQRDHHHHRGWPTNSGRETGRNLRRWRRASRFHSTGRRDICIEPRRHRWLQREVGPQTHQAGRAARSAAAHSDCAETAIAARDR